MAFQGNKNGGSDEYYTPKYIFDALECEFDLDVACPRDRSYIAVPAREFISYDSLNMNWNGFVWMNPPFSGRNGKSLWLDKIYAHGNGIALMPDRTSAPWWPIAAKQSSLLFCVTGKIKFIKPDGNTANSPGTGTTLFAYGEKGIVGLENAEKNKLGIILCRKL